MLKKMLIGNALCTVLIMAQSSSKTAHIGQSGIIDIIENLDIDRGLCGVPGITLETETALNENMRINHPATYLKMKIPTVLRKIYDIGDLETFWVRQDDESGGETRVRVGARLLALGDNTAIWADTLFVDNINISPALADQYIDLLENSTPFGSEDTTLGIYDLEKQYFGNVPDKDGDGIVDFLFSDLPSGVAGYFTPLDQSDQEGSNARDMVYIEAGMTISYTEATLSHELQHLIHYNYDPYEEPLFNEGLSELATIICGGDYISHSYYLSDPTISWVWENLGIAQYSMASLFAVYYSEQFGLDVIKEFIGLKSGSNPLKGLTSFNLLLANRNTGLIFTDFFKNWLIANYLNNKSVDDKYGYDLYLPQRAALQFNFSLANQSKTGNIIKTKSANYIKYLSSVDSMKITFTGSNLTKPKYVAMEFTNSTTAVSEFSDNESVLITKALENLKTVVFLVANTSILELTYDFNSISDDKSGYTDYVEIAYDDGIGDVFSYSGGSFGWLGWGDDNKGKGWAMRFEPLLPQNQLVEYKIMAGFGQEFYGSDLPANSDKDFEIHVWKPDSLEQNFTDIITPFIFSTQRPSLENEFMIVDLASYAEQLKNHKVLYVGFLEDDNIGTSLAMDENADGITYTYAALDSGNGVYFENLSGFSVGDSTGSKSLEGWNYMMRASYYYADTTIPVFSAGFFQNSVFTDELNLYVLGSSLLSPDKVSLSAANSGENIILKSSVLPGNDSILVVRDYRLKSSGALDFNIKGTLHYGIETVDTTFTFYVTYTLAKIGGDFISDNGAFNMNLPANALSADTYIIIFDGNSDLLNFNIENSFKIPANIYTVSPIGKTLHKPAEITLTVPEQLAQFNPEQLTVGLWDGSKWEELDADYISGNRLQASTLKFGQFTVMQRLNDKLDAEANESLPKEFALEQNYPNPFNPATTINYDIARGTNVKLSVYDISGREIRVLKNSYHTPGRYKVKWDGKNSSRIPVVSGIYFYRLKTEQFRKVKKMIIVK